MLVVMQSHSTGRADRAGARDDPRDGPDAAPHARPHADGDRDHRQHRGDRPRTLEVLPGVCELIRVTKPYKLASREMHAHDTVVRMPQGTFGGGTSRSSPGRARSRTRR